MSIDSLAVVAGPLDRAVKERQLDALTVQQAYELARDRHLYPELNALSFQTGDAAVYRYEKWDPQQEGTAREAVLYLGPSYVNPILLNAEQAPVSLRNNGFYVPKQKALGRFWEAAAQGKVTRVRLDDLRLSSTDSEYAYFDIPTEQPNKVNEAQRAVAQFVFGRDYAQYLTMLRREHRVSSVRVQVLHPDYVREHAESRPIMRESWLYSSERYSSWFSAAGKPNGGPALSLRGKEKEKLTLLERICAWIGQ